MLTNSILILFPILVFISACSHQKMLASDLDKSINPQHYELSYQRYSYNLQPISETFVDEELNLIFPAISGAILGNPNGLILQVAEGKQGQFTFAVPQGIDELAKEITQSGLTVDPADTRVLRMGTFHSYPYYHSLGDASFVNGQNGNALIFVYFSQQSRVAGSFEIYNEIFDHQLDIKEAGWSWIEIAKQNDNHYLLKNFSGTFEDIYFAVLLDEMAVM